MGMGEAINLIFVVIITRAWIPCYIVLGFGTQLYHPLRHSGTWESASAQRTGIISLCTDERIHIGGVVFGTNGTEGHCQHE